MLDKQKVLDRANELYAAKKVAKYGEAMKDAKMQTDSALCIIEALVEAFNSRVY